MALTSSAFFIEPAPEIPSPPAIDFRSAISIELSPPLRFLGAAASPEWRPSRWIRWFRSREVLPTYQSRSSQMDRLLVVPPPCCARPCGVSGRTGRSSRRRRHRRGRMDTRIGSRGATLGWSGVTPRTPAPSQDNTRVTLGRTDPVTRVSRRGRRRGRSGAAAPPSRPGPRRSSASASQSAQNASTVGPGSGDHGGHAVGAQRVDQVERRRHGGTPVVLVEEVAGGGQQVLGGRRRARRPAARSARRWRRRRRAARSRAAVRGPPRSTAGRAARTPRRPPAGRRPRVRRRSRPPRGPRSRSRRTRPVRRCRGGPPAAAASRNAASSSSSRVPPATSARASAMPPTIAADDEPRPRACGMALSQRSRSPGGRAPISSNAARIARTTRCVSSSGTLAGALTRDLDRQAGSRRPRRSAGRAAPAPGRASRSPVRGWPRWPGPRPRPGRRRSGHGGLSPARRRGPPRRRRGRRRCRRSSPKPSSAVAVSLSPWPVTVTTTVSPAYDSPCLEVLEQPGDAGGRRRLDEDAVAAPRAGAGRRGSGRR